MVVEEQHLLGELYHLQESLNYVLVNEEMYEELESLTSVIKKLENNIINKIGSWGI
jgi:hypothetical protein